MIDMEPMKLKNEDEKPKGRPRRPMILLALALMALGIIGILWNDYKASISQPTPTPVSIQQTTTTYTTTTSTTTTTTRTTTTTFNSSEPLSPEMSAMLAEILGDLEATFQDDSIKEVR